MTKLATAVALLLIPLAAVVYDVAHAQVSDTKEGQVHSNDSASSHHAPIQGQPTEQTPTMPGQDAFGTVQEIVQILRADPNTDWSKIDLEALRQHLIDMNDVTIKSIVKIRPVDGGIVTEITGTGRTAAAIKRMVPAHASELDKISGWTAISQNLPDGVRLTVTSADPAQVSLIRGLGFIGLMVTGSHHQPHHLAMARGEFAHTHK